ncbi:hypothetical protein [Vibrio aerogenes]|uniref:hypothetical protein n=1 Tax=Vibrio aerogenes TaxID=92172 RepID=UPI0021C3D609|nr:hypothetical protein [Vibrio aerogenes]
MGIKKEEIIIDGKTYCFETENGKTELVIESEATDENLDDPHKVDVPPFWVIVTKSSGAILFILKHSENEHFQIMHADELYALQIQWFEPLADNYRKLIFTSLKESIKSSYKVFTWNDIYTFSAQDRWSISFRSGGSGDWKSASDGADGYILSLINDKPYWSDAVGQIPFAVDTYRSTRSIPEVIKTGHRFATGSLTDAVFGNNADATNTWDNYFVLRGALFASKKFSYVEIDSIIGKKTVELINRYDPDNLSNEITKEQRDKYL